ncbi:hypothetical protein KKB18_04120 [bacterium]|nr:hypothetical protein [Patescibacteria group bacterium]MBU1626534.1 hypothetical protein [bacterium]
MTKLTYLSPPENPDIDGLKTVDIDGKPYEMGSAELNLDPLEISLSHIGLFRDLMRRATNGRNIAFATFKGRTEASEDNSYTGLDGFEVISVQRAIELVDQIEGTRRDVGAQL